MIIKFNCQVWLLNLLRAFLSLERCLNLNVENYFFGLISSPIRNLKVSAINKLIQFTVKGDNSMKNYP